MEGWSLWWPSDLAKGRNANATLAREGTLAGARSLRIDRLHEQGQMAVGGWTIPVTLGEIYHVRSLAKLTQGALSLVAEPLDAKGKQMDCPLAWLLPLSPSTTAGKAELTLRQDQIEPDAGDPPVRFGWRWGANQCAFPTPINNHSPFSLGKYDFMR